MLPMEAGDWADAAIAKNTKAAANAALKKKNRTNLRNAPLSLYIYIGAFLGVMMLVFFMILKFVDFVD